LDRSGACSAAGESCRLHRGIRPGRFAATRVEACLTAKIERILELVCEDDASFVPLEKLTVQPGN
jgi:hypothetical protein